MDRIGMYLLNYIMWRI